MPFPVFLKKNVFEMVIKSFCENGLAITVYKGDMKLIGRCEILLGNYRANPFSFYRQKYHPLGHKLYRTFHNYVALAQDKRYKVVVLT